MILLIILWASPHTLVLREIFLREIFRSLLWNEDASRIEVDENGLHTIMLVGGVLHEYVEIIYLIRGISGSINIDPDIQRSISLKEWWKEQCKSGVSKVCSHDFKNS